MAELAAHAPDGGWRLRAGVGGVAVAMLKGVNRSDLGVESACQKVSHQLPCARTVARTHNTARHWVQQWQQQLIAGCLCSSDKQAGNTPAMLSSVSGVRARRLCTSSPAIGDCRGKCCMDEDGDGFGVSVAALPAVLLSAAYAGPAPMAASATAACSATAYSIKTALVTIVWMSST